MKRMLRTTLIVLAVIVIGVSVSIEYLRISVSHTRIGFFTPTDVKALISAANDARAAVMQNKACSVTIDQSSIGDKKQEAEMLYVAAMLDLYRAKFGVAAHRIEDLVKVRDRDKKSGLDIGRLKRDCYLYADSGGAAVLTCGGPMPSDSELASFVRSAEFVERFYKLGRSEILYIPAPKC